MYNNNGYNNPYNMNDPNVIPNRTVLGEDLEKQRNTDSDNYAEWSKRARVYAYNSNWQRNRYGAPVSPINGDASQQNQPQAVVPLSKKPKEKKQKKSVGFGVFAGVMACAVLLSTVLGAVGGALLVKHYGISSSTAPVQVQSSTITAEQLKAADSASFNAAAVAAVGMDSVVEITTEVVSRGNIIMGNYVSEGAGSGVIVTADGYIATNNHVIEGARKVTVRTRDGKEYNATIVGSDKKTDLAVLKIDGKDLKAATYGTSSDLVVGQPVLAIGNPLGELGGTVTEGIISALDRELQVEDQTMTLLQTDASVNPGNSGGGLFDGEGTLVGIVNAKSSGSGVEGLGFAIPIDTARVVIDEIMQNGYVTGRAEAGIEVTQVDERKATLYGLDGEGVYISAVTRGGAAERAGLEIRDRLVKIDGKEIKTPNDAVKAIQAHKAGDVIDFEIVRDGKDMTVKVTLDEQKPSLASMFEE